MYKQVKTTFVAESENSTKEYDTPLECYLHEMYLFAGKYQNGLSENDTEKVIAEISKKFHQLQECLGNDNLQEKFKENYSNNL